MPGFPVHKAVAEINVDCLCISNIHYHSGLAGDLRIAIVLL